MAKPDVEQIRNLDDFPTMYQWNLILNPPSAVAGADQADLNIRCLTATIPKATGQSIEIAIRGHKMKQPGIYDETHTIELTFVETVDNYIAQFLKNWREACRATKTGVHQTRREVSTTVQLDQLNRQDEPIWFYKLYGCWLEDYDPTGGQFDGTASEVLRPMLTLSYDWFEDGPATG